LAEEVFDIEMIAQCVVFVRECVLINACASAKHGVLWKYS